MKMKFRYVVIMIWYPHGLLIFLFMLLFILPVGKEIYGGNNEPTRVIPFTHTVNSSVTYLADQLSLILIGQ